MDRAKRKSRRLAEQRRRAGESEDVMSVGEALNANSHGVDVANLVEARAMHSAHKVVTQRVPAQG